MLDVPIAPFFTGTFIGVVPFTFLYVSAGESAWDIQTIIDNDVGAAIRRVLGIDGDGINGIIALLVVGGGIAATCMHFAPRMVKSYLARTVPVQRTE